MEDNQNPEVITTHQTPIATTPVASNRKLMIILASVAGFLILGGVVYISTTFTGESAKSLTVTPTTATASDSSKVDERVGWKTYNNATLGFSFQYPERYSIGEFKNADESHQINLEDKNVEGSNIVIISKIDKSIIDLGIEQYILDNYSCRTAICASSNLSDITKESKDDFIVAYFVTGGVDYGEHALVNKGDRVVLFNFNSLPIENLDREKNTQIVKSILSTFKFTDQVDATAGWKSYNKDGVSFKYPADWVESEHTLSSSSPKIRLVTVPKSASLMNECMLETTTEEMGGFVIKRFSRVATGVMCETADASPREIWVMPSPKTYSPGVSYNYVSPESSQAEKIFNQILSTFKFN